MRFPPHLWANLHSPTSSSATEESSEGEESEDANDGKGPQCGQGSQSTPVAARTRSKLKPSYLVLVTLHARISISLFMLTAVIMTWNCYRKKKKLLGSYLIATYKAHIPIRLTTRARELPPLLCLNSGVLKPPVPGTSGEFRTRALFSSVLVRAQNFHYSAHAYS